MGADPLLQDTQPHHFHSNQWELGAPRTGPWGRKDWGPQETKPTLIMLVSSDLHRIAERRL